MEVMYKPLWDKVWIEKIEEEETTSPGGLVLPGKENKSFARGRVLRTGYGHRSLNPARGDSVTIDLEIEEDNIVIFGKYSGTDLGDGTLILKEDEILAIEYKN